MEKLEDLEVVVLIILRKLPGCSCVPARRDCRGQLNVKSKVSLELAGVERAERSRKKIFFIRRK